MRSDLVGILLLAVLAAMLASAVALAAGAGFLAAAVVYCLTGTTLVAGWAGLVFLSGSWPRVRRVRVAVYGRRHPA